MSSRPSSSKARPAWWGGVFQTIVLPLLLALFAFVGTYWAGMHQPDARPLDWFAYALVLAGPVLLVFRRANPPAVFAGITVLIIAYVVLAYPYGPMFFAGLVALFSAVAAGYRLAPFVTVGVVFGWLALMQLIRFDFEIGVFSGLATWLSVTAVVIAAAELWRARRERQAQARAALAETERRRGSEERLRIAQELHDVLGHHVSLINVQAGVALYLMDDDPEQARTALTAIKQSSKDLLREMRSTLGVLRGVDEAPRHDPVPGLDQLDRLVADTSGAGLPVELDVRGTPRQLPPTVDLAAYRIIQESLTNARRHAGTATATVVLEYADDGLTVHVEDDGQGAAAAPPAPGGGNGLPGMRARATALGGTITSGPRDEGGFAVHAHLPTTGASS
ncbi:sensor histidine kinase [Pseudonocardia sp. TRM90224]|uniref:sensor histidine kinase n=1 Tax=Pseudonocardia sp. TRM90224 TaxID=2812678 RepID=UPI001E3C68A4|nr:sensor histidine kinase [Pseudonocardia sp. TRM90224]